MAGHEIGRGHQVGRSDGAVAETQVRGGVSAGLFGVVTEIGLAIFVGRLADNLDGVLIGTHRTVGAQSEEERLERPRLGERNLFAHGQRREGHVVHDAHRELVLGLVGRKVGEHGQHLCGRGIFRGKTVASADDNGGIRPAVEGIPHVEVERFACGTGLLRAVEHANFPYGRRNDIEHVFRREGTVEVHGHDTHLLALRTEIIHRLLQRFGHGPHRDDNSVGIRRTVVGERLVVAARNGVDLLHRLVHHIGHGIVETIGRLAGLEVDVGILCGTARYRVFRTKGTGTESGQRIPVEKSGEIILLHKLDFLYLVRRTESVEEVQKRHARLDGYQMRHAGEVHYLLNAAGGEHGEARLASGHHVLMVAEYGKGMCGDGSRRDMEYARKKFSGNLVHIGNHQQQTLRCGEGRTERTGLERTVERTRSTRFGLHLHDLHGLSEDILSSPCGPFVHILGHGG